MILGIDPGLNKLGWGVLSKSNDGSVRYVASGVIATNTKNPIYLRLAYIQKEIAKITQEYSLSKICMEETFVNNNAVSSMKLCYVRGCVMALVGVLGKEFFEYKPNMIKKTSHRNCFLIRMNSIKISFTVIINRYSDI